MNPLQCSAKTQPPVVSEPFTMSDNVDSPKKQGISLTVRLNALVLLSLTSNMALEAHILAKTAFAHSDSIYVLQLRYFRD
jgi:hypothetical protein